MRKPQYFCLSFLLVFSLLTLSGCGKGNSNSAQLDALQSQITAMTKDLSCTSDSQCQWTYYAPDSCGASRLLFYSTKSTDVNQLNPLISQYDQLLQQYNAPSGHPCPLCVTAPPTSMFCQNSSCQVTYH
jgi:hypothetical protein